MIIGPRNSRSGCSGSGGEVDEDEPFPDVAVHRNQAVPVLVQVEEFLFLLHEREVAVQVVAPGVVLAHELTAGSRTLGPRIVVPHELVAPMPADVVEGIHLAVAVAHHDDRGVDDLEFFGEVIPGARNLFHPAHIEPGPLEHRLAFEFIELRADGILVGHRRSPQLGVVLGPTAFGRLGEARQRLLLRLVHDRR